MNYCIKTYFLFIFILLSVSSSCQETKPQPGEKGNFLYRESFNVLDTNRDIKHGPYVIWYQGEKIVSGNYLNGKKDGLWKYQNIDGDVFFQGTYSNDKKNGSWKYFKKQKPLCVIWFKNDMKDSLWQSFYENGKIQCEEAFSNDKRNGICRMYYENGNIALSSMYRNDSLIDTKKTFYADGTVRSVISYRNGNPYNVQEMNDSLGHPLNPGTLKDGNGIIKYYTNSGKLSAEAEMKNSLMDGVAKRYYENGICEVLEMYVNNFKAGPYKRYNEKSGLVESGRYENGRKTGTWNWYMDGKLYSTQDYSPGDSVNQERSTVGYDLLITMSEIMPKAQGGENGMMKFIQSVINYPSPARDAAISGTVYVTFAIDNTGSIKGVRILRGRDPDLDGEALHVIKQMPPWTPGFQDGFPVEVQFNLPIKFKIR